MKPSKHSERMLSVAHSRICRFASTTRQLEVCNVYVSQRPNYSDLDHQRMACHMCIRPCKECGWPEQAACRLTFLMFEDGSARIKVMVIIFGRPRVFPQTSTDPRVASFELLLCWLPGPGWAHSGLLQLFVKIIGCHIPYHDSCGVKEGGFQLDSSGSLSAFDYVESMFNAIGVTKVYV